MVMRQDFAVCMRKEEPRGIKSGSRSKIRIVK